LTRPHPANDPADADSVAALHDLVLKSLDDDQAQETISIPLEGKSSIADHMVIASGRSSRQVASMAQKLAERIKQATSSAVASTKETVERAADRVEEGLHHATDKAASAANRATDKAAEISERGREVCDQTMDRADAWLEQAREYVREKPVQSVAIALGAGWLLGRILRR
jgi:ElaB/YqjD/DUF883 family membrane-anchored ribosome-binding protein